MKRGEWTWFGHPGHFICADDCRFHLATLVGDYLVSTVGEYVPDSQVQQIYADVRGIALEGRGDERESDWLRKNGFEELGFGRTYETMVFLAGEPCDSAECGCGLPTIDGEDKDMEGYNKAGDATRGHYAMCQKWARRRRHDC